MANEPTGLQSLVPQLYAVFDHLFDVDGDEEMVIHCPRTGAVVTIALRCPTCPICSSVAGAGRREFSDASRATRWACASCAEKSDRLRIALSRMLALREEMGWYSMPVIGVGGSGGPARSDGGAT